MMSLRAGLFSGCVLQWGSHKLLSQKNRSWSQREGEQYPGWRWGWELHTLELPLKQKQSRLTPMKQQQQGLSFQSFLNSNQFLKVLAKQTWLLMPLWTHLSSCKNFYPDIVKDLFPTIRRSEEITQLPKPVLCKWLVCRWTDCKWDQESFLTRALCL